MQPVGLQEWIHKFEEGEGAKYIRLGLFFLMLLALALITMAPDIVLFLPHAAGFR